MADSQGLSTPLPGAQTVHIPSSFGELLRRYGQGAGLTQELPAARAGLSACHPVAGNRRRSCAAGAAGTTVSDGIGLGRGRPGAPDGRRPGELGLRCRR